MWIYILLLVYILSIAIFCSYIPDKVKKKQIYIIFTFMFFLILSSCRGESIGNDTKEYLSVFERIDMYGISSLKSRYEIGYLFLNKIVSYIWHNKQAIIIITSFIIFIGYGRYIYINSKMVWLSIFLFVTLGYFGSTMNTIRHQIALIILMYSYEHIKKNKLIYFLITVIIASLFHNTAIIFLIAYPLSKLKFSFKRIINFLVITLLLIILFPWILKIILSILPRYNYYLSSEYLNGEIRLATIVQLLISTLMLGLGIYCENQNNKFKYENNILKLFLLMGICMTMLSFRFNLLDRVASYFNVFSIIYLPNTIKDKLYKKESMIWIYAILILFSLYFTCIQILKPEWNSIYPYNFFWM